MDTQLTNVNRLRTHENPLVTVIIATYNEADYLEGSITSVLSQSLQETEVLVIDDGSTDKSVDVIQRLALRDRRIRIIQLSRNSGPSVARNIGLDEARGKWIAIMDADDICVPQRFTTQIQFLESANVDLCGSWFVEFGQGPSRTVRWPHTQDALRASMLFQNSICHPTVMARRSVFDRYHYDPEYRLAEDYELFSRAQADFSMANVPKVLVRYRRHPKQATQSQRDAMEGVTKDIRIKVLVNQEIVATEEEKRLHNLIRAPRSIYSMKDFERIEAWLLKLVSHFDHPEAKRTIASQWTRAAVRAAPLGWAMWRHYRSSPLHRLLENRRTTAAFDLAILSTLRLDYRSSAFQLLRRLGTSI